MEKPTDMVYQLTKPKAERDWDFCVLYIKAKNPIMVTKETEFKYENGILAMESLSPHPYPQSQADVKREFTVTNYFREEEIAAVDYYRERKIIASKNNLSVN